ncbi:MAG: glycoside hydrolase family 15 protein [Methanosarcinales archaeon]
MASTLRSALYPKYGTADSAMLYRYCILLHCGFKKVTKLNIEKVIELTKEVIKDCSLENGAIVAANSDKNYYPKDANYYRYVWPRDAAYICVAADILDIKIQEDFFQWCLERAEGFNKEGVFYQRYYTNGLKDGDQFQPDQTGSILWAIWHHYKEDLERSLEFKELVVKASEGLCKLWNKTHFSISTYDLWEERSTFTDLLDNHTYSLAACAKGLKCANEIIENKKWIKNAIEMENQIEKSYDSYFLRTFGKLIDKTVDASLLGLVYPFDIINANDKRMTDTVDAIEKKIIINGGVHRYEFDMYDGWRYYGRLRLKGAGAWPLLNFWMSIYYSIIGDKEKGKKYYQWVLDRTNGYIPEQIFENEIQKSVSPLAWSHAMFAIASKFLEYI